MAQGNSAEQVEELSALRNCSDDRLVELLVRGNKDAMTVIFDRYYALLMKVALRILRDKGEAEDAVQIVFSEFYSNAQKFDPSRGKLSTWLLQYIYGRSINRLDGLKSRRYFKQVEYSDAAPLELAVQGGELFRLTSQEARLFVDQVMESLSEKHRRVVELICFAGLTFQEAGNVTGIAPENIQHYYYRSLKKLRAKFNRAKRDQKAPVPAQERNSSWGLRRTDEPKDARTGEVGNAKAQVL